MCKFQSFSWPVSLCCHLHKCFSHNEVPLLCLSLLPSWAAMFPTYFLELLTSLNCSFTWFFLSRDRNAGGGWCGRSAMPFPQRADGSGSLFPLERLWPYFVLIALPFSCPSHGEIFLQFSLWEPIRVPEGKAHEIVGLSETVAPRHFSFSHKHTLSLLQFVRISLWVFLAVYVSISFCSR